MKQEDKQLLFKDLCARIPYGVIVRYKSQENEGNVVLSQDNICYVPQVGEGWWSDCKPYLRTITSMTKGERKILEDVGVTISPFSGQIRVPFDNIQFPFETMQKIISYLYSIHIDINGLILEGLAIEVTEQNNPYKD